MSRPFISSCYRIAGHFIVFTMPTFVLLWNRQSFEFSCFEAETLIEGTCWHALQYPLLNPRQHIFLFIFLVWNLKCLGCLLSSQGETADRGTQQGQRRWAEAPRDGDTQQGDAVWTATAERDGSVSGAPDSPAWGDSCFRHDSPAWGKSCFKHDIPAWGESWFKHDIPAWGKSWFKHDIPAWGKSCFKHDIPAWGKSWFKHDIPAWGKSCFKHDIPAWGESYFKHVHHIWLLATVL